MGPLADPIARAHNPAKRRDPDAFLETELFHGGLPVGVSHFPFPGHAREATDHDAEQAHEYTTHHHQIFPDGTLGV